MSKTITPGQHVRIVMASHSAPGASRSYAKEFTTFARPGESQADAIKRYMRARRAEWRKAPLRVFPKTANALANTKAYVEAYYLSNFLTEIQFREGGSAGYVRDLFGELSTAPTTWPETDEVTVEEFESCPSCGVTL